MEAAANQLDILEDDTPAHLPRLSTIEDVRKEQARLYRELRDGRKGLKRALVMKSLLNDVRDSLAAKHGAVPPPAGVTFNVAGHMLMAPEHLSRARGLLAELSGPGPAPIDAAVVQDGPVGADPDSVRSG